MKVKYADFTQVTRSHTLEDYFDDTNSIVKHLPTLLDKTEAGEKPVRLLGVTASNFAAEEADEPPEVTVEPEAASEASEDVASQTGGS